LVLFDQAKRTIEISKESKSNPNASTQILPRQGKHSKTKQLQTQTIPGRTPEAN